MDDFVVWVRVGASQRKSRVRAPSAERVHEALGLAAEDVLRVKPLKAANGASKAELDLRLFSRELGVLLDAGIPLIEAIDTLREKAPASVATLLGLVQAALAQGQALSAALKGASPVFDAMLVAVVGASERTGGLAAALKHHAQFLHWNAQLRSRLWQASLYPLLLMVVGLLVTLFLLLYVMPRFGVVFESSSAAVPTLSLALIRFSMAAAAQPALTLGVAAAPFALGLLAWQWPALRARATEAALRLPRLGQKLKTLALARFYRSLGLLLRAGVPAVPALGLSKALLWASQRQGLDVAVAQVQAGERLSTALHRQGLLTAVALRMLRVGEGSGESAQMLEEAAAFHDEELAQLSEWVARVFSPVLMLVMGLLIGTVVVLMYLPIFSLMEQVP